MTWQLDRLQRMSGVRFQRVREKTLEDRGRRVAKRFEQLAEARHPHLLVFFLRCPGARACVKNLSEGRGRDCAYGNAGDHVGRLAPRDEERMDDTHLQDG